MEYLWGRGRLSSYWSKIGAAANDELLKTKENGRDSCSRSRVVSAGTVTEKADHASSQTCYASYAFSQAIIYDDECSCELYPNCTSQAYFIEEISSEMIPIKVFKLGCIPSEAFLSSTLGCFYEQSGIHLIE